MRIELEWRPCHHCRIRSALTSDVDRSTRRRRVVHRPTILQEQSVSGAPLRGSRQEFTPPESGQ